MAFDNETTIVANPGCVSISSYLIVSSRNCSRAQNMSGTTSDDVDNNAGGDVFGGTVATSTTHSAGVSDLTRLYFEVCVMVGANALLSVLGSVCNVINILVYAKMGMDDVVNVSLLGLAVSDLVSVFLVVWCSICYGLFLLDPSGLPFDPLTFWYVTAGWPHFIFSRVTCYITAMVSIERCLCVIAPFKVREIITPRRIKICLIFIFILFPSAYIPVLMVHKLTWKFDPNHNETRIMADYATNRDNVQAMSYYINDVFLPTLSLFVVFFCAMITARSLHRNAEWKKENKIGQQQKQQISIKDTSNRRNINDDSNSVVDDDDSKQQVSNKSTNTNTISSKEMKVVRMLVVICVLFIACYSPSIILIYVRFVYPDLAMYKTYHNLFICVYSFVFLLEVFNSSVNIVIYWVMSSNYRKTFRQLFFRSRSKT